MKRPFGDAESARIATEASRQKALARREAEGIPVGAPKRDVRNYRRYLKALAPGETPVPFAVHLSGGGRKIRGKKRILPAHWPFSLRRRYTRYKFDQRMRGLPPMPPEAFESVTEIRAYRRKKTVAEIVEKINAKAVGFRL